LIGISVSAPDAAHALRLEHAQQARLHLERHFRDLVQQQRAVVRTLEYTGVHA
jgi:hypothetical protein